MTKKVQPVLCMWHKAVCCLKRNCILVFLVIGIFFIFGLPPLLSVSSGSFYTRCKYVAYAMKKGCLPYKDLYDHTGILFYFLNYLGIKISYDLGLIFIQFILMAVGIIFSYRAVRLFADNKIAVLSVATAYVFHAGSYTGEDYGIAMVAIGLYYAILFFKGERLKSTDYFLYAVCFASSLFLSTGLGALWFVVTVAIGIIKIWREKRICISGLHAGMSLLGIGIITVPVMVYLSVHHLFELWFGSVFLYSLEGFHAFFGSDFLTGMKVPLAYILFAALMYLVYLFIMNHEIQYRYAVQLWSCMIGILLFLGIRNVCPFASVSLTPVLSLFFGQVFQYFTNKNIYASRGISLMTAVIVALIFWISLDHIYVGSWEHGIWKANEADRELVSDTRDIIQDIDEADQKFCVFGDWNYIYTKARKVSDSRYFYLYPLLEREPEIFDNYLQEILERDTYLVIIDDQDAYQTPFYENLRQLFRQWLEAHMYYPADSEKRYYLRYYEEQED